MTDIGNLTETYREDGYLTSIDLFSRSEIDSFRQSFDELEQREGVEKCQIGLQARHFDEEFIWRMASDERLIELMADCMGEDILLLSTHFFCKYPDPEGLKFVAWHQDVTYWGLEPPEAHTAWIAVDDSDVDNGCMQVIPGSHNHGIVTHGSSDREGNLLSINQEIPDEYVDKSDVVNLELIAGQMSIHGGSVFHASHPNRSNRRRCGLTVRFIPPHARQKELNSMGGEWKPLLVRGEDRHHHYTHTPPPFSA